MMVLGSGIRPVKYRVRQTAAFAYGEWTGSAPVWRVWVVSCSQV